jgi:hypothetical protein
MGKLLLFISLLFCLHLEAQDTLAIPENEKITFTEKDSKVDSNDSIEEIKFKTNLKKKYNSEEFVYEIKTPEKNAWDRFKEWLARIFQTIFKFSSERTSMSVVMFILKTIAILVVIFVVYLIVKAILNKEGQWIFGKNSSKKIVSTDEIERNLHETDFEKLLKETLLAGQKRISIRYYYLWLLKKMSEKGIIKWDIEKTNSDYLYEITNETRRDEFAYLSYLYNYIWYGEFELDEATFEKAKTAFEKTIRSI